MLILTRRNGESLNIGDDIIVRVLGVRGNQVRIGIVAPKDISVHREEIYKRVLAERGGHASVSRETIYARDDQATADLLLLVSHTVPLDVVRAWDMATIKAVDEWATLTHLRASDNIVDVPARPSALAGYDDQEGT